jgi:hypothetical protein
MWKLNLSLILVAIAAISISRKMRLSQRYERKPRQLSDWSALDKGIDPTDRDKK